MSIIPALQNALFSTPIKHLETTRRTHDWPSRFKLIKDILFIYTFFTLVQRGWDRSKYLSWAELAGALSTDAKLRIFRFMRFLVPSIDQKVKASVRASVAGIEKDVARIDDSEKHYTTLPAEPLDAAEIVQELERYKEKDSKGWMQGRVSGAVYHAQPEVLDVSAKAMTLFASSNPLHPDIFRSTRQMEAEVASMVLSMYNAPSSAGGFVTSGGTESLLMACKTYRDWAKAVKRINRPNMVVPDTIHAAFDKASEYFGIEMIKLPVDPVSFKADIAKMSKAINANTIMIAGSGPNYPHGIFDDIQALGKLAKKHNIGLHVDCCLGGFLVPFMQDAGYALPPFDFRVDGVTSISCDTHKYGFAPKGTSVIMYRDKELRKYQYTVMPDWTGGMYASHGIAGSRAGSVIAGAWASLLKMGKRGYVETTRQIVAASRKLKQAVAEIPELKLIGDPLVSVVAWTTASPDMNIYAIGDAMTKRGWHISSIQNPAGLHVAVTLLVSTAIDELIEDLRGAVEQVKRDPEGSKGAAVAVYGSTASVPDPGIVEDVLRGYLDAVYIAQ